MTHNVRNSGIPALAYPHEAASPVLLSMYIKCNDARAQMTLCLQSALNLQGFDNEQTIILQYDAPNTVPGAISSGPATIPLPQESLDMLVRAGNPQIRTLSLKLRKPCPVWCMPCAPLTPRPGCEVLFHQLAALAEATHVNILFDYNWLHRGLQASLQRLIDHPAELKGFPVGQRYREQRLVEVDWRVFGAERHTYAGVVATVEEGELPPDYVEASSKRPRQQGSSSPAPPSPPSKRVLRSPYQEPVYASPTEKGSTATPSPKRLCSSSSNPKFSPLAALSPLPHTLHANSNTGSPTSKPASLYTTASDVQRAIEQTVSSLLPNLLDTILPRLLTAPSPTPSFQESPASQLSHAAPTPRLSALGLIFHDRLANTLEKDISRIYAHTLSHANFLRSAADDQFQVMLEEERLALERVAEEKWQECKESCEDVEEDVVERVGWRVEEVGEGLTRRVEDQRQELRREMEALEEAKETFRVEREEFRRDKEELRTDKEELRRDKQDLRREKADLRRAQDTLQSGREQFEDMRNRAVSMNRCTAHSTRAGSAPA